MSPGNSSSVLGDRAQVAGTVHSERALRSALQLRADAVDLLEIRVDHFAETPARLLRALPKLAAPLIITVRHPAEGGAGALDLARRRELFAQFLPFASLIDVELRSANQLRPTLADARARGVKVILSTHHFSSTPSPRSLERLIRSAHAAHADICKLATLVSTPSDLACLLGLCARKQPLPLSIMGMGRFGKISRMLLAACGSCLNYGYLHQPNASGQWEAALLKKRLLELDADDASTPSAPAKKRKKRDDQPSLF